MHMLPSTCHKWLPASSRAAQTPAIGPFSSAAQRNARAKASAQASATGARNASRETPPMRALAPASQYRNGGSLIAGPSPWAMRTAPSAYRASSAAATFPTGSM